VFFLALYVHRVEAGRQYQDAVREVLTANAELLVLERKQRQERRR